MGSDKTILSEAGVKLNQDEIIGPGGYEFSPPSHQPVTYLDRLGKVRIEIFPEACSSDDIIKAINFLQRIVAKKEHA